VVEAVTAVAKESVMFEEDAEEGRCLVEQTRLCLIGQSAMPFVVQKQHQMIKTVKYQQSLCCCFCCLCCHIAAAAAQVERCGSGTSHVGDMARGARISCHAVALFPA